MSIRYGCSDPGCHTGDLAATHSLASTTTAGGQTRTSCMVCHADGVPASNDCAELPRTDMGRPERPHGRPLRRHDAHSRSGLADGHDLRPDLRSGRVRRLPRFTAESAARPQRHLGQLLHLPPHAQEHPDPGVGQVLHPGRLPHRRLDRADARQHRREPRTGRRPDLLRRRLPPGHRKPEPRRDAPQRLRRARRSDPHELPGLPLERHARQP